MANEGDVLTYTGGHQAFGPHGVTRLLGPYHLSWDDFDIPGMNGLFVLVDFLGAGNSSGTLELTDGGMTVLTTLDWDDTAPEVQTKLEAVFGAGNVTCWVRGDGRLSMLFQGDLDYTTIGLGLGASTLDVSTPFLDDTTPGNATPRRGRILFTPRVGDILLGMYSLVTEAFDGGAQPSVYYGDYARLDPLAGTLEFAELGAPGLNGDQSQFQPVNEITSYAFGAFSKLDVNGVGLWSVDQDRNFWDAMTSRVDYAAPFALALVGAVGTAMVDPSTGQADFYVLLASPTVTYP